MTYSKSSKREREDLLKIQQDTEKEELILTLIHDGLDVWMDVYVNYGITYIAFVLYVPSMSPSLPLSNIINQSINPFW